MRLVLFILFSILAGSFPGCKDHNSTTRSKKDSLDVNTKWLFSPVKNDISKSRFPWYDLSRVDRSQMDSSSYVFQWLMSVDSLQKGSRKWHYKDTAGNILDDSVVFRLLNSGDYDV